jgi:hypothetical protein
MHYKSGLCVGGQVARAYVLARLSARALIIRGREAGACR